MTTITVAPVTGSVGGGGKGGGNPPDDIPLPGKEPPAVASTSQDGEKKKNEAGLIDIPLPTVDDKSKDLKDTINYIVNRSK